MSNKQKKTGHKHTRYKVTNSTEQQSTLAVPSGSGTSTSGSTESSSSVEHPLLRASRLGDVELLEHELVKLKEINKPIDVNMTDSFGSTCLHLVCFSGHYECLERLLQVTEIDINCKDLFGRTPLFHSSKNGFTTIVQLLLSKGVSLDILTPNGETPLMKAAYYGHADTLKLLVDAFKSHHKTLDEKDRVYGNTALHCAVSRDKLACVKVLIDNAANVNQPNIQGNTPTHLAVIYKHTDCLKLLISAGADLELLNNNSKTPFDEALFLGYKDIASFIKRAIVTRQLDQLKKKDVIRWTSSDVASWLSLIGFAQYKDSFIQNDISGRNLKALNVNSLKSDLSIASLGHRQTLAEHIKKLFKERKKEEDIKMPSSPEKNEDSLIANNVDKMLMMDYSTWHINYSELHICELLGRGFFGEVRRAIWKGTEVAAKEIYKNSIGSRTDLDLFYKELNILCKVRHPNVVQFLGVSIESTHRCIVTEYLRGGSLHQLIHYNWDTLERNKILRHRITCDIIKGMTYLHDCKILHRDLTSKNLLLDSNLNCKISDFGLSRIKEDSRSDVSSSGLGCLPYQAPEVFKGGKYTECSDVFSFGMVIFELVSGQEPHKGLEPLKFVNMVAHEGYRPNIPIECASKQWEKLITTTWDQDPFKRPPFKQLLQEMHIVEPSKFDAVKATMFVENTVGEYTE